MIARKTPQARPLYGVLGAGERACGFLLCLSGFSAGSARLLAFGKVRCYIAFVDKFGVCICVYDSPK